MVTCRARIHCLDANRLSCLKLTDDAGAVPLHAEARDVMTDGLEPLRLKVHLVAPPVGNTITLSTPLGHGSKGRVTSREMMPPYEAL